ncbi:MAG: hypothetical protein F6K36_22855 [Symploca sp. SIO3C6]|nr:hypothetical protein [Symploca sp. SIO3C6]
METNDKTIPTEAIIFIPGLNPRQRGHHLDTLSQGLKNLEHCKFQDRGDAKILGHTGKRFDVYCNNNQTHKILDIYEADWIDIFAEEKISTKRLLNKFISGFQLLWYWFDSRIWAVIPEAPSLTLGIIVYSLLLILWYLSILIMVMVIIGEDPSFFGFNLASIFPDLPNLLSKLGNALGRLNLWISISIILSFIKIDKVIDLAHIVKLYLGINQKSMNLKSKVRERIIYLLEDVLKDYENVTVVAHSFGVTIATDILADYYSLKPIKYITLGGQLRVLGYKNQWLQKEIKKLMENDSLLTWINYYSSDDWLGGDSWSKQNFNSKKFTSKPIELKFDRLERLLGKTHLHYLYYPIWAEALM